MPVIRGRRRPDGKVGVDSILNHADSAKTAEEYYVPEVPDYPPPRADIEYLMVLDPGTGTIEFEERPRNPQELAAVLLAEREEGREEIRRLVREAAALDVIDGPARQRLKEKGILP